MTAVLFIKWFALIGSIVLFAMALLGVFVSYELKKMETETQARVKAWRLSAMGWALLAIYVVGDIIINAYDLWRS